MFIRDELKARPDIHPGVWSFSNPRFTSHVFVCSSIHDATAWLHFHRHNYHDLHSLCYFEVGHIPCPYHAEFIQQYTPNKKLHFIFSKDDTGALCDLKLASYIRNKPIQISYHNHHFILQFEHKSYRIAHLSLNALEKASGYNFRIRTHKPKHFTTFYEQFRNRYHP